MTATTGLPASRFPAQMPVPAQIAMLTRRCLLVTFRESAAFVPGLLLGVFFLVIYDSSLSGAASFFLPGEDYLGFILPLSVISTALSGAGIAGEALLRDIKSGYFDKLRLTPVSRAALLLAPMIAAALIIVVQTSGVTGLALLLGLQPATGLPGLLALLVYALLVALALAGLIVGIALRTGSSTATSGATFLVFPFTFLTSSFTPVELLSGWLRVAAELNPITYILDATRALLNTGWDPAALLLGLFAASTLALLTFAFAWFSLRARTRQR